MSAPTARGPERLTWLLLLVALVTALWLARRDLRQRGDERGFDPVAAVPQGPELLVTADFAELGTDAARELLRAGGGALLGLRELCGFEPLLGLRRAALAMPLAQPGQNPDFALIADTRLEPEAVLRCAEAVIRKRGGIPARSRLGDFWSVRDQKRPLGEVAMRADGLFVLSGGQYLRDLVDQASGSARADAAASLRSRVHEAIRRRLGTAQLELSLMVGPSLPVPGVKALGLALELERELRLRGLVVCQSPAACVDARRMLEQLRSELSQEPGLAELSGLRIAEHGSELGLGAQLPKSALAPLVRHLLAP